MVNREYKTLLKGYKQEIGKYKRYITTREIAFILADELKLNVIWYEDKKQYIVNKMKQEEHTTYKSIIEDKIILSIHKDRAQAILDAVERLEENA